jgi:hypothetical protein
MQVFMHKNTKISPADPGAFFAAAHKAKHGREVKSLFRIFLIASEPFPKRLYTFFAPRICVANPSGKKTGVWNAPPRSTAPIPRICLCKSCGISAVIQAAWASSNPVFRIATSPLRAQGLCALRAPAIPRGNLPIFLHRQAPDVLCFHPRYEPILENCRHSL